MSDSKFKMPSAFTSASATISEARAKVEAKSHQVEARINMSAEVAGAGLCPECQRPMELSHANGIPVFTCDVHRIALPAPNEKAESHIPI